MLSAVIFLVCVSSMGVVLGNESQDDFTHQDAARSKGGF